MQGLFSNSTQSDSEESEKENSESVEARMVPNLVSHVIKQIEPTYSGPSTSGIIFKNQKTENKDPDNENTTPLQRNDILKETLQRSNIDFENIDDATAETVPYLQDNINLADSTRKTAAPNRNDFFMTPIMNKEMNSSDLDSIFDSPRKAKLRKQLRKKNMLQKKHTLKIKRLQNQNRRLKNKNASLKQIINILKKEQVIDSNIRNMRKNTLAADLFSN